MGTDRPVNQTDKRGGGGEVGVDLRTSGKPLLAFFTFANYTKKLTKTFFADFLKCFGIFFFKASSAVDPPIKIEARSFEVYLHLFFNYHH